MNCYWSSLFHHRGAAYILGTSQQYGSIVIRRSDDGGFTWTHPKDAASGLALSRRRLSRTAELSLRACAGGRSRRPCLQSL